MYSANIGNYRPERNDIKVYTEDKLGNPHYSSRLYKCLSHYYDPGEWSVYVDADIFLPEGMEMKLIAEVAQSGKEVGAFKHPWRDCSYQEGAEVINLKKDTRENVDRTLTYLSLSEWPELSGLAACGVIVRKNIPAVEIRNQIWWQLICLGSKRDQISFPYVFQGMIHYFDGNIYDYKK